MRHKLGYNEYLYSQKCKTVPVIYDTNELLNGHLMIAGMTGSGKSYQLIRLINAAAQQGVEIDIFDVHDELSVPSSRDVVFSEATRYGYNLLELSNNPHTGGVRRRINDIIRFMADSGYGLGSKQEAALRNLLSDVYSLNGCYDNKPATWTKRRITLAERDQLISGRQWKELKNYYPVLDDVITFAQRKLKMMYMGADGKAISALEDVNRKARKLTSILEKMAKPERSKDDEAAIQAASPELQELDKARDKAIDSYTTYVNSIQSGREFEDLIKYNSKDVLISVLERLTNLNAIGIFTPNPPPFGGAKVRCHKIKSLNKFEQRLYVYSRLDEIYRKTMDDGKFDGVRHVVVLDEAANFFVDDADNVINRIARESRKFGLAMWCAAQNPTHFSDDFLSSVGATILLGVHSRYWDDTIRKMRIDRKALQNIKPKYSAAVKFQRAGEMEAKFQSVLVTDPEAAAA